MAGAIHQGKALGTTADWPAGNPGSIMSAECTHPDNCIPRKKTMSENSTDKPSTDSFADAVAALALILIAVSAAVYWVSHQ